MRTLAVRARVAELWSEPFARVTTIVCVLIAALTLIVLVQLRGAGEPAAAQLVASPIAVAQSMSPTTALFGDTLEAEIDVFTSDGSIDPGSVRVEPDFRPYRIVSTRTERARRGSDSLLRTRFVLDCLTHACLPSRKAPRRFQLRPTTVLYSRHQRQVHVTRTWAPVLVSSRLGPSLRAQLEDTPPRLDPGFRVSPTLARIALALLAALLALAGSALVASGLWPRFFYSLRRWRRLTPLERALAQVEAAAAIDDESVRRRVLEQLALRLREAKLPALERQSRALAWGSGAPQPDALELLAGRVRGNLNGSAQR